MVMADSGNTSIAQLAPVSLVNNELLCALRFYYSQLPYCDLVSYLSEFYMSEEIVSAKHVLFTAAKEVWPEGVHQPVARRGVNKRFSDMEDILALFAMLDAKKISLPTFTATNLGRIPTALAVQSHLPLRAINDAIGTLGESVNDLQQQMESVLSKLEDLKMGQVGQVSAHSVIVDAPALSSNPAARSVVPSTELEGASSQFIGPSQPSRADRVARIASNPAPFRPSPVL
jgi:hypothetical protein